MENIFWVTNFKGVNWGLWTKWENGSLKYVSIYRNRAFGKSILYELSFDSNKCLVAIINLRDNIKLSHKMSEAFVSPTEIVQAAAEQDSSGSCELSEFVVEVINNPKLLSKILSICRISDLKQFRLICHLWNDLIIFILQQKPKSCLRIDCRSDWDDSYQTYVAIPSEGCSFCYRCSSIKTLTTCMENSPNFPIKSFSFYSAGNLKRMLPFFVQFGTQLKSLKLTFDECQKRYTSKTSVKTVQKIIFEHCPNLLHLQMGNFNAEWWHDKKDLVPQNQPHNFNLPQLKSVEMTYDGDLAPQLEYHVKILKQILSVSPNLEEIENFESEFVPAVLETEKYHLVKSLLLHRAFPDYKSDELLKLSKKGIKLKSLSITRTVKLNDDERSQQLKLKAADTLNLLFKSSQLTLKYLAFNPFYLLDKKYSISLPNFKNLEKMKIFEMDKSNDETKAFWGFCKPDMSSDISFMWRQAEQLSSIEFVHIIFGQNVDTFWQNELEAECVAPVKFDKVNKMIVEYHGNETCLNKLVAIFPNVNNLTLIVGSEEENVEAVWGIWQELKFLRIEWVEMDEKRDAKSKEVISHRNKDGVEQILVTVKHFSYEFSGNDFDDYDYGYDDDDDD